MSKKILEIDDLRKKREQQQNPESQTEQLDYVLEMLNVCETMLHQAHDVADCLERRLVRIETKLCKLAIAMGHEDVVDNS